MRRGSQKKLAPLKDPSRADENHGGHKFQSGVNWLETCPFCLEEQKSGEMAYEFTVSYILKMYQNFKQPNQIFKMNQDFQGIISPSNASD